MRPLVWLRTDLRADDNLALHAAARDATSGCLAVFLLSPGEWRAHDWAPVKVDLVLRTLAALSADLAALNIPLLIAHADEPTQIPVVLKALAHEHACDALYYNREYEVNERRRDADVERTLGSVGLQIRAFDDQVMAPPGSVRTGAGGWYTVFSPFKRALYARFNEQGLPPCVPKPRRQPSMPCPPSPVPSSLRGFESTIDPALWPAGEREAMRRLDAFIERRLRDYKRRRDFPAIDGTSALSPYLNIGAISCRRCLAAAAAANPVPASKSPLESGNDGAVHWISELVWREFYIHVMVGFPRVSMGRAFQLPTERIQWRRDPAQLDAWKLGRTGVPIVDAGMRQLIATGWMHNRVRMITAMYLTKNLLIHWQEGERHFMTHLVDGFLASNNGGWQWSASTGTDAAPYFRIFNPVSQSQKFDPDGIYIRRFVPELRDVQGDAIHEPWELPGLLRGRLDYPDPLVDLARSRDRAIEAFRAIKDLPEQPAH